MLGTAPSKSKLLRSPKRHFRVRRERLAGAMPSVGAPRMWTPRSYTKSKNQPGNAGQSLLGNPRSLRHSVAPTLETIPSSHAVGEHEAEATATDSV